jgi:hypothetical protein
MVVAVMARMDRVDAEIVAGIVGGGTVHRHAVPATMDLATTGTTITTTTTIMVGTITGTITKEVTEDAIMEDATITRN